jgi:Tol biopolymer transport system component
LDFQVSGFAAFKRFALKPEVQSIASLDWSTDGKSISAQLTNTDRSMHIALISTADGSSHVLKDLAGPYVTNRSFFSPDGKYVAYDRASTNASPQRDIFVLPTDGGPETLVVGQGPNSPAYNMVMGWGPDGHLFYASDAMGPVSLWALPILNGKPQGAALLVKSGLSNVMPMGVTQAGTLYYFTADHSSDLYTAGIDLNSGRLTSSPVRLPNQPVGLNRFPAWSPDGKQLAYVTEHDWGSRFGILSILSGATGRTREVRDFTQLTRFFWVSWSPDSRSILAQGVDPEGNDGIYRVDAITGAIEPLVLSEPGSHLSFPMQTPDGLLIYCRQIVGNSGAMYVRDLTSKADRKLLDGVNPNSTGMPVLSPDGRYLHFVRFDAAGKEWTLSILPVAGGNSRDLLHVNSPQALGTGWWTPDSKTILYTMSTSNAPREYWMIPLTGGDPRRLILDGDTMLRLHPDGKQAIFSKVMNGGNEIWAIENPLNPIPGR